MVNLNSRKLRYPLKENTCKIPLSYVQQGNSYFEIISAYILILTKGDNQVLQSFNKSIKKFDRPEQFMIKDSLYLQTVKCHHR